MEEIKSEESHWDKKKIIGALLALVILGFVVKVFALNAHKTNVEVSRPAVKGVTVEGVSNSGDKPTPTPPSFNPQKILQQKLEEIKAEVQSINIAEIASSSPQVQKALNDLKALEAYPKNQAKDLCQKICSSF